MNTLNKSRSSIEWNLIKFVFASIENQLKQEDRKLLNCDSQFANILNGHGLVLAFSPFILKGGENLTNETIEH